MNSTFKPSAESLYDFFSLTGRGFYIPYYQRNYSWDEENANKLIEDIFSAVSRTAKKPNNTIFLGTVILHDEKNLQLNVHVDTPNLMSRVSNVVDGQQRITSLAVLACVLSKFVNLISFSLKNSGCNIPEFVNLITDLLNETPALQEFYSVEIRRHGAQPAKKPLIIRAGDVLCNPASDQWTLCGQIENFYRSRTSNFFANVINGVEIENIEVDERLKSVIHTFDSFVADRLEAASDVLANDLVAANNCNAGSLSNFLSFPPDLSNVSTLDAAVQKLYFGGLQLLAVCSFLKHGCHLVVIDCSDEGLAFDMFQSLNATGTPLTAFEVFKPAIVKAWAVNYPNVIKPHVDRIERVFDQESTANRKEDLTEKVICATAMVYAGENNINRFSDQRDWLINALNKTSPPSKASWNFIECLADQAEYYDLFVRPRKSKKDANTFSLVNHLTSNLGMLPQDADLSALCIFYLRDAQHQMAHLVISIFYSRLLRAKGTPQAGAAAKEFLAICKATAAFFTLWMGASRGRFPDSEYRKLFDQSNPSNISILSGHQNQTTAKVIAAYLKALEDQNIYDLSDPQLAKKCWVDVAKYVPWYQRKAVCRFGLFIASNDAVADLSARNEGLFISGKIGVATLLTCKLWHSSDYEVIEHVATRDKPRAIKYTSFFDASIYPGNYSVVDKIGNLTLLSQPVNSSVYSEWPDKIFYYWSLTTPETVVSSVTASNLMLQLGIASLPPSLMTLQAASSHIFHLAPLAYRGVKGEKWDAAFIDIRSEHLCGRIFDVLNSWF